MCKDDNNLVRTVICVAMCAWLAGCSQNGHKDAEQLQSFLQKKRSPVAGVPYRVLPPDHIGLASKYVREIDGIIRQVRPDGKIALPLIGEVFVAGKTLREIGQEIDRLARQYYKRVDVTVHMAAYNSQKIYVFGQVARAGPRPWTGADTILDVLARVQPTLLAWPEKIKVIRGESPKRGGYLPYRDQVENENQSREVTVDLMAMITKGDMSHNILLWPDDIIYVPANPPAKVGLVLRQLLFPVQPVLEAVRVPKSYAEATDIDDDRYYED